MVTGALAGLLLLQACTPVISVGSNGSVTVSTDTAVAAPSPPASDSPLSDLVVEEQVRSRYSRDLFSEWQMVSEYPDLWPANINPNCNTRWAMIYLAGADVLWEDFGECIIVGGSWRDPYGTLAEDGTVSHAVTDDPYQIDIDHLVPLAEAWESGADAWTPEEREVFANDPDNLVAVSSTVNRSKGDSSADQYLPPGDFRCEYVERYVQVKLQYELTVSQPEYDTLVQEAGNCSLGDPARTSDQEER